MKRLIPIIFIFAAACGDDSANAPNSGTNGDASSDLAVSDLGQDMSSDAVDAGSDASDEMDVGSDAELDAAADTGGGADLGSDSGSEDMGTLGDAGDSSDGGALDDAGASSDAGAPGDAGSSGDVGSDAGADMASGGYDTTGWTMKRWTKSESASSGTPDSYFFDVDSGSPLSVSISGGGSGVWSVNVFGGMTNQLHCTGSPSCQVMLDPRDTVVIITAITTGIGSYVLTVDYSGMGLQ